MAYETKVYVVQKANAEGELTADLLGVKLTHLSAHQLAKAHAPAAVRPFVADKLETPQAAVLQPEPPPVSEQERYRRLCNQLQLSLFDLP
jgi:hypothetical protein